MLRACFDTQILIAESKGLIAHDFWVFFMWHVGSRGNVYYQQEHVTRKTLDAMQKSFARVEKYQDIETIKEDKSTKAKQNAHALIQNINPKQLEAILEALGNSRSVK